jgi:hypothetical protein
MGLRPSLMASVQISPFVTFWEAQEVAFLDVRVVDSDAASYVSQPAMHALVVSAED